MNSELFDALELLEKTKGIPVDYMLEKIEAALVSAFKKEYGSASVRVDINKDKKEVRVFRRRTVVEEVTDPKTEISLEKAQEISRRYELGSVIEDEIKGKNVLVIDDVYTTGATINECARVLKRAGARKVYSITAAQTAFKPDGEKGEIAEDNANALHKN